MGLLTASFLELKSLCPGLSLNCESVRIAIDTDDETYFNVSNGLGTAVAKSLPIAQ
jgi:hypothetical protein